jgi:membrane protein implicated in regulation of membrane protease activity
MNWTQYLWLGLIVLFLVVEAACPIHLVSIWFAAGALAALLLSWINASLGVQIAAFILVSVILLASLWPLVRRYINPKITQTNVDAVIGSTGLVTADINNVAAAGQVKLGAMEWTARSESGEPISAGTLVRVVRIEGVKLIVSPVQVPAQT